MEHFSHVAHRVRGLCACALPGTRLLAAVACLLVWACVGGTACQHAPRVGYAESVPVLQKRESLFNRLVALLPEKQRTHAAAQQEARWLADTAYKASASIARSYKPCLPGWLNNRLVNSNFNLQERGLCWHYQHDMYRELRRRHLSYFRVGCCVRDQGKGSEHNCVFVAARNAHWPQAVILDAWRYNGRLKLILRDEMMMDAWKEDVLSERMLARIYTECHSYPVEHWARVKSGRRWNEYLPSNSPRGRASRQGMMMQENIYRGMRARGGRLTDY